MAAIMRRGPSIMLAIGLPSPMAHEDDDNRDEDHLSRENENDDNGDDDPTAVLGFIQAMREQGPAGVKLIRAFANALLDMGYCFMEKDDAGVEDAACAAHEALSRLQRNQR